MTGTVLDSVVTECGCHVPPWASFILVFYEAFDFSKLHLYVFRGSKTCLVVVARVIHELSIKAIKHSKC